MPLKQARWEWMNESIVDLVDCRFLCFDFILDCRDLFYWSDHSHISIAKRTFLHHHDHHQLLCLRYLDSTRKDGPPQWYGREWSSSRHWNASHRIERLPYTRPVWFPPLALIRYRRRVIQICNVVQWERLQYNFRRHVRVNDEMARIIRPVLTSILNRGKNRMNGWSQPVSECLRVLIVDAAILYVRTAFLVIIIYILFVYWRTGQLWRHKR